MTLVQLSEQLPAPTFKAIWELSGNFEKGKKKIIFIIIHHNIWIALIKRYIVLALNIEWTQHD